MIFRDFINKFLLMMSGKME